MSNPTLPNLPEDFDLAEFSKNALHKNTEMGKPNVIEPEICSIEDEEKHAKQREEELLKKHQQFQESLQDKL